MGTHTEKSRRCHIRTGIEEDTRPNDVYGERMFLISRWKTLKLLLVFLVPETIQKWVLVGGSR